jgi:outer membrane protein, multidrug efflux system
MRNVMLLLLISVFLYGCPRASQYARPQLPVPSAWPDGSAVEAGAANAPMAAEMNWREFFTDERVQSVIGLALENNRDLRIAALNVEKFEALYRIQRAEQFPTIGVVANGSRAVQNLSGDGHETLAQYTMGLGVAGWELDLFGSVRSLKNRALEEYLATGAARSAAQISLVSAVGNAYLAMAADQESLHLAEETLQTQQASYELIRRTTEIGIGSDLDLRQAQSQVEAARLDIARYSGQIAQDRNALDVLVGTPVEPNMLPENLSKIAALKEVGAGLPSEVLLRRPDILMSEHELKAADANIGYARAAFFPRIALTSGIGLLSTQLADLFKAGATSWTFAPQLGLPIFDQGSRKAGYKAAQVDRNIAIARYEKSIQSAFREASDALSLRTSLVDQQEALQALIDSLQETYRLSEARYKGGIDSYLSVLIAQRSVYAAEKQMVGLRLARMTNLVTLYKVLGGGA